MSCGLHHSVIIRLFLATMTGPCELEFHREIPGACPMIIGDAARPDFVMPQDLCDVQNRKRFNKWTYAACVL